MGMELDQHEDQITQVLLTPGAFKALIETVAAAWAEPEQARMQLRRERWLRRLNWRIRSITLFERAP
jgi:hypothetical protein